MICDLVAIFMAGKGTKWNKPIHNFNLKSPYNLNEINDFCWNWEGALDKDGYGIFTLKGKKTPAHVASYILAIGNTELGKYTLHKCNNPSCVNPLHLYQGTQKQNIQDQINLGTFVKGSKNGMAILTEDDIKHIRIVCEYYSCAYLAKAYKVSYYTMWDIIKGRTWKHVK